MCLKYWSRESTTTTTTTELQYYNWRETYYVNHMLPRKYRRLCLCGVNYLYNRELTQTMLGISHAVSGTCVCVECVLCYHGNFISVSMTLTLFILSNQCRLLMFYWVMIMYTEIPCNTFKTVSYLKN